MAAVRLWQTSNVETSFRLVAAIVFVVTSIGLTASQQALPPPNYDEANVGNYSLPDPLVFNNGEPVRTANEWLKRRQEVLELFAENMFGHSPLPPKILHYDVWDTDRNALAGKAIRKQITIYFSPKPSGPKAELLLYIPTALRRPAPVFLTLSFNGNQMAANDPAIKLATTWNPKTHEKELALEESRGKASADTERILARGYALATICYTDIEPDFKGGYGSGVRPLFLRPGQSEPGPGEWGAIGAWSYGLSRVMDYLEKDRDVDARRVAIVGHSRLGKTALWAGAMDQRFAMVIASCSGEGGASLARRNYGETLANLNERFPFWFAANFARYSGHPDQLPVDMHELIALSAPRPVYITAGETDRWADPKGEFLACVAAGPVYRLLKAEGLGTDQMPALDQPIMHTIAYHIHTGGHAITPFDWEQFLTFADKHLHAG